MIEKSSTVVDLIECGRCRPIVMR